MTSHAPTRIPLLIRVHRLPMAALAAILALPIPAVAQTSAVSPPASAYEQLQAFSGVLSHIRNNYVDSVEFGALVRASIEGMLRSLDPHSRYLSRRDFELEMQWDRGELAAPGVVFEDNGGGVVVQRVLTESPAARNGVQAGDRLLMLGDTTVAGLGASGLNIRLLGEKDTRVRLTFARGGPIETDTFTVTLKRALLPHHVAIQPRMLDSATGYVQLAEFTPPAPKELGDAIRQLRGRGARQLVLDLRGNGGGHMGAMVEIASSFLPAGTEVFHLQGRKKLSGDSVVTRNPGEFAAMPLVLLIDESTASASETLAGALQDHDRALLIGRRSFGKGIVQSPLPLPVGDVVWLTTARVVTPSGRVIQRRYSGLSREQYQAFGGRSGAAADTLAIFHTDHGREVRGGGGITPDVNHPTARLPAWFSVAVDSGLVDALVDTVSRRLGATAAERARWSTAPATWDTMLVRPLVERTRQQLRIAVLPDSAARGRLGLALAAATARKRWGADGAADFIDRNDPDLRAAISAFPHLPELLGTRTAAR